MRTIPTLALAALGAVLLAPALPAQWDTLAAESFDYTPGTPLGGLNGGWGWMEGWWSGGTGDNAIVETPGFDPVGHKARTVVDNGGSWRTIETIGMDPILDPGSGLLGADGTTIWVRFRCQRTPGSDDDYGGLSLYVRFGGEMLFLGSPSFTNEWGLHDVRYHPAPQTVPGSNCDVLTWLVYRIDFLPGQERVQLWLDPPVDHPTTVADLDVMVDDFRFNEIRLQSGNSFAMTGFDFDDIVIDTPLFRPIYTVSNLVAGGTANFDLVNCTPGGTVITAYSLTGRGPTPTPFGLVAMAPPIRQLPPQTADSLGEVHFSLPVPPQAAGVPVWTQSVDLTAGILSNPLALTVQ